MPDYLEEHTGCDKKMRFLKNEPKDLLKIKDLLKNEPETDLKRTGNEAGQVIENTGRAEKRSENEPKNEAGHLVENKRSRKTNREIGWHA